MPIMHVVANMPSDWVMLGVDAGITLGLYLWYRHCRMEYQQIKDCPDFTVGSELKDFLSSCPDNNIAYGSVTGFTTTQETPIKSHYDKNVKGVIQRLTLLEHRTQRIQGFWSDADRTIRNNLLFIPFELAENRNGSGIKVEVQDPLEAQGILDSMRTTYDKFEPNKTSIMERIMERLFGEVSKGFQEKEKMLGLGTRLMGIGKLVLVNNQLRIEPPANGYRYHLTWQTKSEVLNSIKSSMTILKWLTAIVGAIGLGYGFYLAYVRYKVWQRNREMRRAIDELRAAREGGGGDDDDDDAQMCVICISNPREVIMLDCGHICVCLSCAEALPEPRLCPFCRQNINRFIPVYIP